MSFSFKKEDMKAALQRILFVFCLWPSFYCYASVVSAPEVSLFKSRFLLRDFGGEVHFRTKVDLKWKKVIRPISLMEGDLISIGKESFVLIEIQSSASNPEKRKGHKKRIYHDQEGILNLGEDIIRNIKLVGSILRVDQGSRKSTGRKNALRSFRQAYSKAKVISFNNSAAETPSMKLGRIGEFDKQQEVKRTIKIVHPSSSDSIYYEELPKEIDIHWRPLNPDPDLERQYAVFIWKDGQRPKTPLVVTDQTSYTYKIREPGRFRVKVLEVNTNYESFASSDFKLMHVYEKESDNVSFKELLEDSQFRDFMRTGRIIFLRYPLRNAHLMGKTACHDIPLVFVPIVGKNWNYELELVPSDLGIKKVGRVISLGSNIKDSKRKVVEEEPRFIKNNDGLVYTSVEQGSYTWKVVAYSKTGNVVGRSVPRDFRCDNSKKMEQFFAKSESEKDERPNQTWVLD